MTLRYFRHNRCRKPVDAACAVKERNGQETSRPSWIFSDHLKRFKICISMLIVVIGGIFFFYNLDQNSGSRAYYQLLFDDYETFQICVSIRRVYEENHDYYFKKLYFSKIQVYQNNYIFFRLQIYLLFFHFIFYLCC